MTRRSIGSKFELFHICAAALIPGALVEYKTGYVGIFVGLDSAAIGDRVRLDCGHVWEIPAASALTGSLGAEVGWDADGGDGTGQIVAADAGDHNGLFLAEAKTSGQTTAKVIFRDPGSDIDTTGA